MKRDVKEAEEVKEVKEKSDEAGRVAAFFDLDGTLTALPSLERRFFRVLRQRGEIPLRNYFLWLKEAAGLAFRGIQEMLQANKMYLRGARKIDEYGAEGIANVTAHKSGHQEMGQAPTSVGHAPGFQRSDARLPVPDFLADGVERVAWHVKKEHAIVLASGTLEPLANVAARRLEAELAERGLVTAIRVCATRLGERDGQWTGKVLGEAMFGEAKARAVRCLAVEMGFDLAECFAYGDSATDVQMLETVGRASAVNPSERLARIAEERGWPTMRWQKEEELTQRAQRLGAQRTRRTQGARSAWNSHIELHKRSGESADEMKYGSNCAEQKKQVTEPMRLERGVLRSMG